MKSLCESCGVHWDEAETGLCRAKQEICVDGVEYCREYKRMVVMDREDDGTEHCGLCGKLHWGWEKVCPVCGTDYGR